MALSKRDALDAARAILQGARTAEAPRLDNIKAWMTPGVVPTVEIPTDAPDVMRRLAAKADTNYLPLVVKAFSQRLKVDGYYSSTSPERSPAWQYFRRNRMQARQTGTVRAAISYGASYELLLPGSNGPVSQGLSPRRMTAVYQDPASDEYPMLALDVDGSMMRLFDETNVYYIGVENKPRGLFQVETANLIAGRMEYIESRAHDAGVCPVVRFQDRMLLDGEEQFGIVEPLIALQSRINETTFGMLVAQFFSAFKQRYVIGWVPQSEADAMAASASDTWYFDDDTVKVGQFNETDLTKYIEAKNDAKRDLAAIGQISLQSMGADGVSNISAEALASLQDSQAAESDEMAASLGESWEQWFRLACHLDGDEAGAADFESEVRYADKTARSFAQTVDGLGKLAQMLGVPVEILWEKIPDMSDTDIQRATQLRRRDQARERMQSLATAAQSARVDPQVAGAAAQRGTAQ